MARVIFSISYPIKTGTREQYLETIGKLRDHLRSVRKVDYSVYEQQGKKNTFSEVIIFRNNEEYDTFEDVEDETYDALIDTISNEFVKDGKSEYRTLIESV